MTSTSHADAAELLLDAYETAVPSPPLTVLYPSFDVADAYQVQSHQLDRWRKQGRTVAGRKVGLTSQAMQAQLGVDQPDFGVLLSDRGHLSGDVLETARFISPRVEPELAFVLSDRLRGPGVTVSQAVAAISVSWPVQVWRNRWTGNYSRPRDREPSGSAHGSGQHESQRAE